ncbi:DUF4259 domain-containing protein [Duganella callida]|uniref:DUF4259 domain-containing protein n=1 Tax=Duganella callida TaxID=2561932 RepID=A0A4Y9S6S3_9BURK|nr:DUF4259 domain-containing protein [Duganella callida]
MKRLFAFLLWISLSTASWAGAWGAGSFENDDALDCVASCTGQNDESCLSQALQAVRSASYVEAPDAAAAVAAAEVIAAVLDSNQAALPTELRSWLAKQDQSRIRALAPFASTALNRIANSRVSELAALWSEDAKSNWDVRIKALAGRLSSLTKQSTRTR